MIKKQLANIITSSRIVCSLLLLLHPPFSIRFYTLYLLCGVSDMIDGAIARKMGSTSKFGARLDTVADLVFTVIAFIKFLPIIHIPVWLWIWVGGIAIIKIGNIIWGLIYKHALVALHTILNKITGVLLFILPLTLNFIELKYSAIAICTFATFATIQEIHSNFTKLNTNS